MNYYDLILCHYLNKYIEHILYQNILSMNYIAINHGDQWDTNVSGILYPNKNEII